VFTNQLQQVYLALQEKRDWNRHWKNSLNTLESS
jgi:hypothetical protein